jgi:hypothetical protein
MNFSRLAGYRALLCLAVAGPLAAQAPAPRPGADPEPSIIVTGEKPDSHAEHRREAGRFVDSHAVMTRIGQLARWHDPICVRTWGLPLELNARISSRIMDIAESVGVRTNRAERCAPNVRIGFTSEPQEMIERAYRRNRVIIGFHYAARTRDLMRVRQPVQAWYVTTTRARPSGAYNGTDNSAERIDQVGVPTIGQAGSRLSNGVASGLAHVLIFADSDLVAGQDTAAITELLAYLALAQTPVAQTCDQADTILNLMNPDCPPARRPTALTE